MPRSKCMVCCKWGKDRCTCKASRLYIDFLLLFFFFTHYSMLLFYIFFTYALPKEKHEQKESEDTAMAKREMNMEKLKLKTELLKKQCVEMKMERVKLKQCLKEEQRTGDEKKSSRGYRADGYRTSTGRMNTDTIGIVDLLDMMRRLRKDGRQIKNLYAVKTMTAVIENKCN